MIYDQDTLNIGATFVGEEHSILSTLIRLQLTKSNNPLRIVVSPTALTIIQSGNILEDFKRSKTAFQSISNSDLKIVGTIDDVEVVVDPYLSENEPVRIIGDEISLIEVKNIRFI